ncbi:cytochrome P450 [Zalerion maritima]|uniref:Cytochrome P450 n=1 Tax=Zalerion maritima TaxID=339359 RepID=A0AAD5WNX5_9PEZI|nr:cytochrome P450 [Zalerion maritima]
MSTSPWSIDLRPSTLLYGTNLKCYVALAVIAFTIWWFQGDGAVPVDVPYFKAGKTRWMFQADELVRESYEKKFKDRVYKIKATEGVQVLIPPKMVAEIKGLPEETLSATEAVREALMSKYTNFCAGSHSDLLTLLVRTKLGQNLARLAPVLREELEYITSKELPECDDWTSVKVQPFALRTVARLSGRAFVGPEICRREEWMDVSINYAVHVFVAVVKLQFFPAWMRPAAKYLVKELGQIKKDVSTAREMVEPMILSRIKAIEEKGEKPDDFAQWLLDGLPEHEKGDIQTQTELQLILSAASIHTTNNLLTDCVLDLAAHPDMQDMLRDEVVEILNEEGGWDRKETISRLKKMDSFIKETQRLAGNVTSFIRKVCNPITLSDGTYLPVGTNLLAPLAGVSHDPRFLGMMEEVPQPGKAASTSSERDAAQPSKPIDTSPVDTPSPTDYITSAASYSEYDSESVSGSTISETPSIFDAPSVASSSSDLSSYLSISKHVEFELESERTPIVTTFDKSRSAPLSEYSSPSDESNDNSEKPMPTDAFDGLRYYKLRRRSQYDANRWQFTSLSDSNMNFGGGKHACPGRFFAGCEIKTILAFFLSRYELRLVPGDERPKSMTIMMTRSPNPEGMVQFRKLHV